MSILFVLLMFLLIISITYFVKRPGEATQPAMLAAPPQPEIEREIGFDVPKGYCFHPGHTWVLDEGRQNARIGLDAYATNLLGKIDRIEVIGLNRWVRQGQKLMMTHGGMTADLVSGGFYKRGCQEKTLLPRQEAVDFSRHPAPFLLSGKVLRGWFRETFWVPVHAQWGSVRLLLASKQNGRQWQPWFYVRLARLVSRPTA